MNHRLLKYLPILFATFACAHSPEKPVPALDPIKPAVVVKSPIDFADEKLKANGIPEDFILQLHKKYLDKKGLWEDQAMAVIEPNVFGFLYHGNYFAHDSVLAHKKIKGYLRAHRNSFKTAEARYHVSSKSIASLLWVETRLGKNTGSYPLPFIFYALSLSAHPKFCSEMAKRTPAKLTSSTLTEKPTLAAAQAKLEERCQSKSNWAIEEMKALVELSQTRKLNPFELKASFAGAFGIPQFIPSSFKKYAVSSFRKKPNLYLISDAILSVGNFLHENGWKDEASESQSAALYSYNRSKDYGLVITQIAKKL
jgi:membrane-bound lytic murein transglycosylase B